MTQDTLDQRVEKASNKSWLVGIGWGIIITLGAQEYIHPPAIILSTMISENAPTVDGVRDAKRNCPKANFYNEDLDVYVNHCNRAEATAYALRKADTNKDGHTTLLEAAFAWKNYDSRAEPIGQVMIDYVKEMFE